MSRAVPILQSAFAEGASQRLQAMPGGMTSEEARKRLAQFGPNELASARPTSTVVQIPLLFANPLLIILLIASIVSAFLGQVINAVIIAAMVLISSALHFIFELPDGPRLGPRPEDARIQSDGGHS